MRILAVVAVAAVSLALAGCYVQSVHPLHTEDKLTVDPGLVGTWADEKEPGESTVIRAEGQSSYKLTFTDDGVSSEYEGHLVQLGESVCLDMFPAQARQEGCGDDFMPLHLIFRIQRDGDEMKVASINHEWLTKMLDNKEVNVPHFRYEGRIVLSMETEQLQHVLMGFAGMEEAFEEPTLFHRVE